ncbi:MAG: hypothetical protein CL566_07200 [Alphaproteobacteria bacterium]|nr:hypothetical protein [Alphaproteobacteria bacterium]
MVENSSELDAIVADARQKHRDGALADAASLYDTVLAEDPDHVEALHLKGILSAQKGNVAEGLELLERAVLQAPTDARVRANYAKLRLDTGDIAGAVEQYQAALTHAPDDANLLYNTAGALVSAARVGDAIDHLERARTISPDHGRALANLGNLYRQVGQLSDSRAVLEQAVAAAPNEAEVQHSLGVTLAALLDYKAAADRFREALACDPGFVRAATQLFYVNLYACDWADRDKLISNFVRLVENGGELIAELSPMVSLFLPFEQPGLNAVAAARAASLRHRQPSIRPVVAPAARDRLHVGYLSPDLGRHPVGHLLADILPRHDRERFEVSAFALKPADGSDVQKAIYGGMGRVEDISQATMEDAVGRIVDAGVDILVDLSGFTRGGRPEILAARSAPLQIGWLGYCGSSGGLNDVLLADETLVHAGEVSRFSDAVAHMPGTFMPLNRFDTADTDAGARSDHGLPDDGFVYCAFNTPTKIDPVTFGAWMDILGRVDNAVLWLRDHADVTRRNLTEAARQAGIDPDRLVFAPLLDEMSAHLARHAHADLFLDSFVYGAHSTAADAIAQGLPVLTLAGDAMPSRVGASLCRAHRLGDLVADSPGAYVTKAVSLAEDEAELKEMKKRVRLAVESDDSSERFVRKLEGAYQLLWNVACAGQLEPGALVRIEAAPAGGGA